MAEIDVEKMSQDIEEIRKDVDFLKRQATHFEVMTAEDEKKIEKFLEEKAKGKTTSSENLKVELEM